MKKLHWLHAIRKEYPSFRPSWQRSEGDLICFNHEFASVLHVVACDDHGAPVYDQPVWAERPGAVVVGVDERGHIAVIEHSRGAPLGVGSARQTGVELAQHGRVSFEFPRGNSNAGESPLETAVREAEEETGLAASDPELIGETNQNTTYFLFNTAIVRVRLSARTPRFAVDATEPIKVPLDRTSVLKPPAEVAAMIRTGQIFCGFTKSAFASHLATRLEELLGE